MAKVKQVQVQSTKKTTTNLSKVSQPRVKAETKTDQMTEMVTDAFKKMAIKEGITLAKIRNYIAKTFAVQMSKPNQTMIKKILGKGFREGDIVMTDDRGGKLDYTKRFAMVDEVDEDEETESDTSVEE